MSSEADTMNELEECFYALHRQSDLVRRVTETLKTLQSERDEAREEVERLRCEQDSMAERFLSWRGIEYGAKPCPSCGGSGVRSYSNTTTWRGGYGGQAITSGVCDGCWGSGDPQRPWANLRKAQDALRTVAERQREACAEAVDTFCCMGARGLKTLEGEAVRLTPLVTEGDK